MKQTLRFFMISILCLVSHLALHPQSVITQARSRTAANNCPVTKFHNLSRYRADRWSGLFRDREVAPALKSLLRSDYGLLKDSLQEVNYPDSLSLLDKEGVLTLEGGAPHLYTIMEAKLIIEPCGHIYAAILDQGERFLYFTNDRNSIDRLPPEMDRWRAGVEKRRREGSSQRVPQLPVVYKSK